MELTISHHVWKDVCVPFILLIGFKFDSDGDEMLGNFDLNSIRFSLEETIEVSTEMKIKRSFEKTQGR